MRCCGATSRHIANGGETYAAPLPSGVRVVKF